MTAMRLFLLLVLAIATTTAADLFHARVALPQGGEIVGWWDPDARVIYLPNGRCQWVKEPKAVRASPPGADAAQRPARRAFKRLPDLPYGEVKIGDVLYTGWYHQPSGEMFFTDPNKSTPFHGANAATLVRALPAPDPMPAQARDFLDHWAIAHADEVEAKK